MRGCEARATLLERLPSPEPPRDACGARRRPRPHPRQVRRAQCPQESVSSRTCTSGSPRDPRSLSPIGGRVTSAPLTHDTEGTKVKPLVDVSVNVYAPPAGNPTNPQCASRGSPGRRYVLATWEPRRSSPTTPPCA